MKKINFVWDIHYKCNFRCPYCWFNDNWEAMEKLNANIPLERMVGLWKRMRDRHGECHIMITGGEPSLYPDFIELIDRLSKMHTIKVTSQLSGDYLTFAERINPDRVQLDMNFHPKDGNFDDFLKKVLALKRKGFKGGVCYLAYPPQMDKIEHYRKALEINPGLEAARRNLPIVQEMQQSAGGRP